MLRRMSKGMQKQAAFWLAMCCMPEYLILDEPVDGLDPVMRRQVWSAPAGRRGGARARPCWSRSHNLRELEDVCDHVGIMNQGKVLLERSLSDLQDNMVKLQVAYETAEEPRLPAELQILHRSVTRPGPYLHPARQPRGDLPPDAGADAARSCWRRIPLTLEEIFIYEMGGADYAVRDIIL